MPHPEYDHSNQEPSAGAAPSANLFGFSHHETGRALAVPSSSPSPTSPGGIHAEIMREQDEVPTPAEGIGTRSPEGPLVVGNTAIYPETGKQRARVHNYTFPRENPSKAFTTGTTVVLGGDAPARRGLIAATFLPWAKRGRPTDKSADKLVVVEMGGGPQPGERDTGQLEKELADSGYGVTRGDFNVPREWANMFPWLGRDVLTDAVRVQRRRAGEPPLSASEGDGLLETVFGVFADHRLWSHSGYETILATEGAYTPPPIHPEKDEDVRFTPRLRALAQALGLIHGVDVLGTDQLSTAQVQAFEELYPDGRARDAMAPLAAAYQATIRGYIAAGDNQPGPSLFVPAVGRALLIGVPNFKGRDYERNAPFATALLSAVFRSRVHGQPAGLGLLNAGEFDPDQLAELQQNFGGRGDSPLILTFRHGNTAPEQLAVLNPDRIGVLGAVHSGQAIEVVQGIVGTEKRIELGSETHGSSSSGSRSTSHGKSKTHTPSVTSRSYSGGVAGFLDKFIPFASEGRTVTGAHTTTTKSRDKSTSTSWEANNNKTYQVNDQAQRLPSGEARKAGADSLVVFGFGKPQRISVAASEYPLVDPPRSSIGLYSGQIGVPAAIEGPRRFGGLGPRRVIRVRREELPAASQIPVELEEGQAARPALPSAEDVGVGDTDEGIL